MGHQRRWRTERLASDVPAIGVQFLDQYPDDISEGLGSFVLDHHIGQVGGHRVLLFLREDAVD